MVIPSAHPQLACRTRLEKLGRFCTTSHRTWSFASALAACLVTSLSAFGQARPFTIGGPSATLTSSVCAPPRDEASRKGLDDLQRGISPPNVATAQEAKALLNLRIGYAEGDEVHLLQAIDQLKKWPEKEGMQRAALIASLRLAALRRDLLSHATARQQLTQMLHSSRGSNGQLVELNSRQILVRALYQEADGLGGAAGRSLWDEAIRESTALLSLAPKVESNEGLRLLEGQHRQLLAQRAFLHRDADELRKQIGGLRDALDVRAIPVEQFAQLDALGKALYDLASLVRGDEGLKVIGELRWGFDQQVVLMAKSPGWGPSLSDATYRGLESAKGHWQINMVQGDSPCLQRVKLQRQRAMVDILEQSLLTDAGHPDAARVHEAIAALQRAQVALSRQPQSMQPSSLELGLGVGYRLLAAASVIPAERAQRIDQAAVQFDASEQRLRQCFCGWQEEELARERVALERLRGIR